MKTTEHKFGKIIVMVLASALNATHASADTAVTGYGGPGNQMNPSGMSLYFPRDPAGLSMLSETTRTPTGLLYPVPFLYPDMKQSASDPDWWSSGWAEAGLLGSFGRTRSAAYRQYTDRNNGPLLTNLGFLAENHKTALYISGLAEDAGRSGQYFKLTVGRYGVFNVTAFFDSIPHDYSTDARSIWNGVGTADLTLRGGLTPGSSTPAQVSSVAAAPSELRVTREKAGVSLSYTPYKTLEAFMQIANEWRNGAQPISATFGYPFQNGAMQLPQPVHYRTLDVTAALRYKEDDFQANLTYTGSFFRNQEPSLTWQNPGLSGIAGTGAFIPPLGRLSLPPNNDYHSLKGDVAVLLSPQARFAASLSYSLMRQNDALLPPTVDSGMISGVATPINLDLWNTTLALSRPTAKAAIDIFNAFAQFQYTFSSNFSVDFELRDRNESNLTNYVAFNPITGQYGYIAIDGGLAPLIPSLSGVYEPAVPRSLVQIKNIPFANDRLDLTAKASYRLDNHLKLDVSYVHSAIKHSAREVPNADDNRARVQLVTTGHSWGTVRVSYEFASLTGSDYNSNPYTPYYSSALPGYIPKTAAGDPPFALSDLRKFDVANHIEHKAQAQGNYIVSAKTDIQLTGDLKIDDYDARYGLRSTTSYDVNAAVNYQMSLTTVFTGFFNFQGQNRGVANINTTGLGTSGAAGSPAYPLSNAWREVMGSHNYTAGLTARHRWGDVSLDVDYTFAHDNSALRYSYAGTGAFFGLLTPAQAGSAFPDITFDAHALAANLLWQYTPKISFRLNYRFDYQRVDDFHYTGLTSVINNNVYLGVAPENFTAQTIGLFVQYAL